MASEADPQAQPQAPDGIGPLAREDGAPAFGEPWQAQVLAIAASLAERGLFSASDWAEALGAQLRRADAEGAPDSRETYYAAALAALEGLLAARGVDRRALAETKEAWRRAYLATPHGQPVELKAGK